MGPLPGRLLRETPLPGRLLRETPLPGRLLRETLSGYADVATAQAASDANAAGLSCSQGVLADMPVVVIPAEDVQLDVGGEWALAWNVGSAQFDTVAVAVQAQRAVVDFAYVAPVGSDPATRRAR